MDNFWELMAQPTFWGLTIGQTVSIFVVAAVLLIGWVVVRVLLQLGSIIFRLGCAALIVFICGIASFLVLYNVTSTRTP
jgi:hypothetical protein